MSDKFKKGEIATVLTIGAFIFLSAATLISTVFLKDKKLSQTTTTKAAESGYFGVCLPAPPISQDTQYTPTGYRWKADCSRSCTNNSDCPTTGTPGIVNPSTSNWCYGFSDGMKCMVLEKIPGAPIYTCPDGGIPKGNGDCEYGKDALHSDFYVEQGTGKCGSCILVLYSGGFPYGSCRYSNADVCRPSDYQGGCRGVCNRNCCNDADTITQSGEVYEASNPAGKSGLPSGGANPTIPGGSGGGSGTGGGGTTGCTEGKKNLTGACDPACCSNNSECPNSGETCWYSNQYCKSGFSCMTGGGVNPSPIVYPTAVPTASLTITQPPQHYKCCPKLPADVSCGECKIDPPCDFFSQLIPCTPSLAPTSMNSSPTPTVVMGAPTNTPTPTSTPILTPKPINEFIKTIKIPLAALKKLLRINYPVVNLVIKNQVRICEIKIHIVPLAIPISISARCHRPEVEDLGDYLIITYDEQKIQGNGLCLVDLLFGQPTSCVPLSLF